MVGTLKSEPRKVAYPIVLVTVDQIDGVPSFLAMGLRDELHLKSADLRWKLILKANSELKYRLVDFNTSQ
jgi:hypothetical protein